MPSVFDSEVFSTKCFFPRSQANLPPPGAEDMHISVEGARLHLRWHRLVTQTRAPTVLLFHGNGEVVSDYDEVAVQYARLGLNLAVSDFRGYGASSGTPTLRSMLADAAPVLEAVAAKSALPVVVMGRSLGSACALELFQRDDERLAGVILESGFIDLDGLVRRRGLLPPPRYSEEEQSCFDGRRKVAKGRGPLLIIHGAKDRAIDADEAREAYRLARSPQKRLALIAGKGHNDLGDSPSYWEAIAEVWKWPALAGA